MQVDADYKALSATHCCKHLGQLLQAPVGKLKLVLFLDHGTLGAMLIPVGHHIPSWDMWGSTRGT